MLFVIVRQLIPEDLADVAPGPELARVLAGIEVSRLSGYDCVEVLKARYRQVNHERAQLMVAMVEVGLCAIGPDDELPRRAIPDEFSTDEVRAALGLTRRAAHGQFWLAHDLLTRLPAVHAALNAGLLDEPRARVLSEWTTDLTPEQARAVCEELLARVPALTTGQLIDQIKKLALAIDPDWARRRYEHAVADRKVIGYRNPDGSANLSGLNLPVDRVAAACGHIDALAKAAKHAGDLRPIDHLRADLFLGMTDGTYAGLDDTTILDHLRTTHHRDNADNGAPERNNEPRDGDDGPGGHSDDEPSDDEPSDDGPGDDGPGDDGPGDDGPGDDGPGDDGPGDDGPDDGGGAAEGGCPAGDPMGQHSPAGAGMELRVRLSTLLGRDEYPGELAGWGPIHADLARDLATTLARGQWRFAITDEQGQLLHCGITGARPIGSPTRSASSRQIVELQIPATTLHDLAHAAAALGAWAPVIADLAHQHTTEQQASAGDPTRYTPSAAVRRYVQIRDRYCIMIGCRAPAHGADTDHTLDAARGGATVEDNLGNACRHDHRVKHEGGWQLHQPEPGLFRWTSRLGHTYQVRPPPIIEPLPDPIPGYRPPPLPARPDDEWDESSIWDDTPPEADTKPWPRPPPQPNPHDETPPPF